MTTGAVVKYAVIIDRERCKACGLCIAFCPAGVLAFADTLNSYGYHPVQAARPDDCTGCQSCVAMCPDVCIEIYRVPSHRPNAADEDVSGHGAAAAAD